LQLIERRPVVAGRSPVDHMNDDVYPGYEHKSSQDEQQQTPWVLDVDLADR